jgi:hypothetical protein
MVPLARVAVASMDKDEDRWSDTSERTWIIWTALVAVAWSVWYLLPPTIASLYNFAAKIRAVLAK